MHFVTGPRVRNGTHPAPMPISPNVRFGSLADKPSMAKIQLCRLLSNSDQILQRSEMTLCANRVLRCDAKEQRAFSPSPTNHPK